MNEAESQNNLLNSDALLIKFALAHRGAVPSHWFSKMRKGVGGSASSKRKAQGTNARGSLDDTQRSSKMIVTRHDPKATPPARGRSKPHCRVQGRRSISKTAEYSEEGSTGEENLDREV
jgi:hypothetical protein